MPECREKVVTKSGRELQCPRDEACATCHRCDFHPTCRGGCRGDPLYLAMNHHGMASGAGRRRAYSIHTGAECEGLAIEAQVCPAASYPIMSRMQVLMFAYDLAQGVIQSLTTRQASYLGDMSPQLTGLGERYPFSQGASSLDVERPINTVRQIVHTVGLAGSRRSGSDGSSIPELADRAWSDRSEYESEVYDVVEGGLTGCVDPVSAPARVVTSGCDPLPITANVIASQGKRDLFLCMDDLAFIDCGLGFDPNNKSLSVAGGLRLATSRGPLPVTSTTDLLVDPWYAVNPEDRLRRSVAARGRISHFLDLVNAGVVELTRHPVASLDGRQVFFNCPIPDDGREELPGGIVRARWPQDKWWGGSSQTPDSDGSPAWVTDRVLIPAAWKDREVKLASVTPPRVMTGEIAGDVICEPGSLQVLGNVGEGLELTIDPSDIESDGSVTIVVDYTRIPATWYRRRFLVAGETPGVEIVRGRLASMLRSGKKSNQQRKRGTRRNNALKHWKKFSQYKRVPYPSWVEREAVLRRTLEGFWSPADIGIKFGKDRSVDKNYLRDLATLMFSDHLPPLNREGNCYLALGSAERLWKTGGVQFGGVQANLFDMHFTRPAKNGCRETHPGGRGLSMSSGYICLKGGLSGPHAAPGFYGSGRDEA